ncbi:MAG: hypothetical protein BWY68_00056 [bacterium ADurb.Bin400]|nr:MAG: hypothetical protein BWY68_00056 [bacterium ADurb.Bin400]
MPMCRLKIFFRYQATSDKSGLVKFLIEVEGRNVRYLLATFSMQDAIPKHFQEQALQIAEALESDIASNPSVDPIKWLKELVDESGLAVSEKKERINSGAVEYEIDTEDVGALERLAGSVQANPAVCQRKARWGIFPPSLLRRRLQR